MDGDEHMGAMYYLMQFNPLPWGLTALAVMGGVALIVWAKNAKRPPD